MYLSSFNCLKNNEDQKTITKEFIPSLRHVRNFPQNHLICPNRPCKLKRHSWEVTRQRVFYGSINVEVKNQHTWWVSHYINMNGTPSWTPGDGFGSSVVSVSIEAGVVLPYSLTSKCPLRRTKVLEQSTMRQMTTCRTTPVTEAVPLTQPIPGRVVSRYSHRLNSLLSDSCTETHRRTQIQIQTHTHTGQTQINNNNRMKCSNWVLLEQKNIHLQRLLAAVQGVHVVF